MKLRFLSFLLLSGSSLLAAPGDTLGVSPGTTPQFAPANQITLPPYQGGYAFGVNFDPNNNFIGIGQGYLNDEPANVVGVLSFIGAKSKGVNNVPDTKLTFRLHNMSTSGAFDLQTSPIALVPTDGPAVTVLASKSMFFDEIDTTLGAYNYVEFDSPTLVNSNLVITVDLLELKSAGDVVGFYSDVPGDAGGIDFAFHQANVAGDVIYITSRTVFQGALDNNIAIFPVLQPDDVGILDQASSFQGVKAIAMPNPANESLNVQLALTENAKYILQLFSTSGQKVKEMNLGSLNSGTHNVQIPVAELESGSYFYSIISDKGVRFCRTVVISH